MNEILDNIKAIRTKLGYSQEYVASKLNMEQGSYAQIENGKRRLRYDMLEQIAIIFNCHTVDIITFPEKWSRIQNCESEPVEVTLMVKLRNAQKEEVLRTVFGTEGVEILTQ